MLRRMRASAPPPVSAPPACVRACARAARGGGMQGPHHIAADSTASAACPCPRLPACVCARALARRRHARPAGAGAARRPMHTGLRSPCMRAAPTRVRVQAAEGRLRRATLHGGGGLLYTADTPPRSRQQRRLLPGLPARFRPGIQRPVRPAVAHEREGAGGGDDGPEHKRWPV
jgi:hypothetical protein